VATTLTESSSKEGSKNRRELADGSSTVGCRGKAPAVGSGDEIPQKLTLLYKKNTIYECHMISMKHTS